MESQTLIFTNSPYNTAPPLPFYTPFHTPPYTFNYSACPEAVYQPFSMSEDVLQMPQQVRFPTPPNTPPRGFHNTTAEFEFSQPPQEAAEKLSIAQQQRTQTVIMKIGQDQNPQYLTSYYVNFERDSKNTNVESNLEHNLHQLQSSNDTHSSGTSSPSSQNEFICDWIHCGRYFESLELLAHHVTLVHAVASLNDGLYYCRWTGCQRTERGFNARYKMLVHVRTHTKEKPHQCHLCDKRFSRAENLKIHIRSHSGEKPYVCTFDGCNKAYSNSSDRFKHTRTHSMEKPYMCKVTGCQKRYTDPSSLRKHVKTFKHLTQTLNLNAKATVSQPKAFNGPQEESRIPDIEESRKYRSYLPSSKESASPTVQDSFCIALEEMCHIKSSLNNYSSVASTLADEESYWSKQDRIVGDTFHYHHTKLFQQTASCNLHLDLTTEKPLDLRVKRS